MFSKLKSRSFPEDLELISLGERSISKHHRDLTNLSGLNYIDTENSSLVDSLDFQRLEDCTGLTDSNPVVVLYL